MFSDLFPSRHQQEGMSLFEVNEVIRRTGHLKGFEVIAEYPVKVDGKLRKVDWVWRDSRKRVIHVFEIEGANVPQVSLDGDIGKFEALKSNQARPRIKCWVVSYSARFSLDDGWHTLNASDAAVNRLSNLPNGISWVKDSALINELSKCAEDSH